MINKIITESLLSLKRVVVPHFGAFIHKEGDGMVVFVSFLKKDDGVLSSLVRNSCGISQKEADEMISEYVAHVKSAIESKGSFLIENLGAIKVDSNGLYHLIYAPSTSCMPLVDSEVLGDPRVQVASVKSEGLPTANASGSGASGAHVNHVISESSRVASMTNQIQTSVPTTAQRPPQVIVSTGSTTQDRAQVVADSRSNTTPFGQQPIAQAGVRNQLLSTPSAAPVSTQQAIAQQTEQRSLTPQARPQESVHPISQPPSTPQVRPTSQTPPQVVTDSRPNVTQFDQQGRVQVESQNQPQIKAQQSHQQSSRLQGATQRPIGQVQTEKRTPVPQMKPKRDDDKFMIIAIIAAIIAVAAIAYGLFSSDGGPDMEQIMRSVEQAKDTIMVDNK